MPENIQILLIDDDLQWTGDLRRFLPLEPSMNLVALANTAQDGIQKAITLKPQVILVSQDLPDANGATVIQQIRKEHPQAIFIAQMSQHDPQIYTQLQSAGAHQIILKNTSTSGELVQMIRQTWDGFSSSRLVSPSTSAPFETPPMGNQGQATYPSAPAAPTPYPYNAAPNLSPNPTAPYAYPPYGTTAPMGTPSFTQAPMYASPNPYANTNPYNPMPSMNSPYGQAQGNPYGYPPMNHPEVAFAAPRIRTTCIAVNSPKGGVGKSSFSKELACAFALAKIPTAPGHVHDQLKVCLVDMDLDYGNIAPMLRMDAFPNISTWAEEIHKRAEKESGSKFIYTPEQFMPFLLTHAPTGLKVLAAPLSPTQALNVTGEDVEIIIDSLKAYFDVVILDTGNNTRDYTLISLEKAQKAVIVTTPEVPTIRNVQSLLETMKQIQYPTEKLNLVINGVNKNTEISIPDIVNTLNIPFLGTIPEDPRVPQANNHGEVLVVGKETEYTSSIRKIGHQLVPVFKTKKVKESKKRLDLFGFLKKKKD